MEQYRSIRSETFSNENDYQGFMSWTLHQPTQPSSSRNFFCRITILKWENRGGKTSLLRVWVSCFSLSQFS